MKLPRRSLGIDQIHFIHVKVCSYYRWIIWEKSIAAASSPYIMEVNWATIPGVWHGKTSFLPLPFGTEQKVMGSSHKIGKKISQKKLVFRADVWHSCQLSYPSSRHSCEVFLVLQLPFLSLPSQDEAKLHKFYTESFDPSVLSSTSRP